MPTGNHQVDLPGQAWVVERIAAQWQINPEKLGWMGTGLGISVEDAITVASIGKTKLSEYARQVFDSAEQAVAVLNDDDLSAPRYSIIPRMEHNPSTGKIKTSGASEKTIVFDLLFHFGHSGRHLGMIEALRGALFSKSGTATV